MIVTVVYYEENSKAPKLLTFSDIEKAKEWVNDEGQSFNRQNIRIMVDYSAIEAYQEMYNLMKERVFGNETNQRDRKEI